MNNLSIADLARVSFPNRGERGMFAMLEFYFDDSGTHDGSDVIVWGGVTGHKDVFDGLDADWKARLERPTGKRTRINKFSLSNLLSSSGEFSGYNQAERDRVRRNFRQMIIDHRACVLAFCISRRDWDDLAPPAAKLLFKSAEGFVFAYAVMASCNIAREEGQPLTFIFDKGRYDAVSHVIAPAIEAARHDPSTVGYGFQPVVSVTGLQAADLVAGEAYRYGVDYLVNQEADPNPHMVRLLEGAQDQRVAWFGRKEIASMLAASQPALDRVTAEMERASRRERP